MDFSTIIYIEELTLLLMYLTSWEEEMISYDDNNNLEKIKIKKRSRKTSNKNI